MSFKKLKTAAQQAGMPLDEFLPKTIEETGSIFQAAIKLGVTPNSIHYWMKKNGYTLVSRPTLEKAGTHV